MHLIDIKYKNFMAVGATEVHVPLDTDNLTIISGRNGAGKSTVSCAITYALFGKVMSNAKIATLINTTNKKKMVVEIAFKKYGDVYTVRRGEKPKLFEIYKNDELIDQSANARDYQKLLENIIGFSFKTFVQVAVLTMDRYEPLMSMTPAQRRGVVDELLDVGIFSEIDDVAKTKASAAKSDWTRATQNRDVLHERVASQQRLIDTLIKQQESGVADLERERDEVIEDIGVLKGNLSVFEDELAKATDDKDAIDIESIKSLLSECRQMKSSFTHEHRTCEKEHAFFSKHDVCPTCTQAIDSDFKATRMDTLTSSIKELEEGLEIAEHEIQKLSGEEGDYQQKLSVVNDVKREISDIHREIESMNKIVDNIDVKISKLQESNEGLDGAYKDLELFNEQLDSKTAEAEALEAVYERYNQLRQYTAEKGSDGIKQKIIREYMPVFNRKINDYLYAMEFFVGIELDENFNETFIGANKAGFAFDQLSTGQQCRVNMAIWLALLEVAAIKNSVTTNVLILDEILGTLDGEGVEAFIRLCREKLPNSNVFVVLQRPDVFKPLFDRTVEFDLVGDFTEMVIDNE